MTLELVPDLDAQRARLWRGVSDHALVRHNPKAYARLVKRQRTALGLTQAELAKRAGITRMTIWSVESNIDIPNATTVHGLNHAMGLTHDDLRAEIAAMHDDDQAITVVASLAA